MSKYYEVKALNIDGQDEVLFGSFDRSDCTYEMQAERVSWKADGYTHISLTSRLTTDQPDPQVYGV